MAVRLDFDHMMAPQIPTGPDDAEWRALRARFGAVHEVVTAAAAAGRYGFLQLEAQSAEHDRVRAFAAASRGRYEDVVVLGIGGSALGAIALRTALGHVFAGARLHVLDNVDPAPVSALLASLSLGHTLFCVVSKSGTTVETLAQYSLVRSAIARDHRQPRKHMVFITDPVEGPLREAATKEKIDAFEIPPNVGGRFSVLTPVGMFPAAIAGYDTSAILAGAREMRERCSTPDLAANPAGVFAMLQWRAHQKAGQGIHVMMPYADALRDIAPWFVQLWAESLGKVDDDGAHVGPTPLAARGATDQHSQLQLYMQGPADKTVTFLVERDHGADMAFPDPATMAPAVSYLKGRTLGELLDAEQRATTDALASVGRPSMTIELGASDAYHVGALLMLLMKATIYAGALYRVNPLDQPGVELGKKLAREALVTGRRTGAEPRWIV